MENQRSQKSIFAFTVFILIFILINLSVVIFFPELNIDYQSSAERQTLLLLFDNFMGLCVLALLIRQFLKQKLFGVLYFLAGILMLLFLESYQHFILSNVQIAEPGVPSKIETFKSLIGLGRLFFAGYLFTGTFFLEKNLKRNLAKNKTLKHVIVWALLTTGLILYAHFIRPDIPESDLFLFLENRFFLYLASLFLVLAALKLYFKFVKTRHRFFFWFSFGCLIFAFGTFYSSLSGSDLYTDLSLMMPLFGFMVFIVGISDDTSRFLETETKIRVELERSLFETEKTNQKLQLLFEKTAAGLIQIDGKLRIISADEVFEKITGYKVHEIKGRGVKSIIAPTEQHLFKNSRDKWARGDETNLELALIKKNGRRVYTFVDVLPVLDSRKNFTGATLIVRDISLWKEAELGYMKKSAELKKSLQEKEKEYQQLHQKYVDNQSFYHSILAAIPEIILVVNNKGVCTYINEYGKKRLGFSAREMSAEKVPKFILDLNRVKSDYGDSVDVQLKEFESVIKTRANKPVHCLWTVQFLLGPDGKRTGTVAVGKDISAFHKEKTENERKYQVLAKELKEKTIHLEKMFQQTVRIFETSKKLQTRRNQDMFLKEVCGFFQSAGWHNAAIFLTGENEHKIELRATAGSGLRRKHKKSFLDIVLQGKLRKYLKEEFRISRSFLFDLLEDPTDRAKKRVLIVPIDVDKTMLGWIFASTPSPAAEKTTGSITRFESVASYIASVIAGLGDHQKAERSLAKAKREGQIQTEFYTRISHELRSPLNAILTVTELLRKETAGPLNSEQNTQIRLIGQNSQNLLNLINNFLDTAKIKSDASELFFTYFSMDQFLKTVRNTFEPLCKNKGLTFSIQKNRTVPQFIFSDEEKLTQILSNLLSNAIKFTDNGKVELKITHNRKNSSFHLSVADTGMGISKRDLANIFQEFKQIKGQRSGKSKGSGLGLNIVKNVTTLLGGEIKVESDLNKGSRFDLLLPMKKVGDISIVGKSFTPALVNTQRNEPRNSRRSKKGNPKKENNSNRVRHSRGIQTNNRSIILIDDDQGSLYATRFFLEEKGFRVAASENGESGFRQLKKKKPDLIVLDMVLPGINGIELTEKIRKLRGFKDVPILMTSGKTKTSDRARSLQAGCNDYLTKPFTLETLYDKIVKLLK